MDIVGIAGAIGATDAIDVGVVGGMDGKGEKGVVFCEKHEDCVEWGDLEESKKSCKVRNASTTRTSSLFDMIPV